MNSSNDQEEAIATEKIEEEIMLQAVHRISSSSSIRFMEDAHADDPSKRSAWKSTTFSQASIAPPAFVSRRSSLEFNDNFIDGKDFIIHGNKEPFLSSVSKKGGNDQSNTITEKGINANNKRWTPMTTTSSSQASSTAPPAFDFNNNFIDDGKKKEPLLSPIIKKGWNNHSKIIIEEGINANNKRWTPMTTTSSSQASTAPPAFVNRRSSLEFYNNFIDDEDFIIHGKKIKPLLSSIIKKGGNNHSNMIIEKGNNANSKRWTSSSQASLAPPAFVNRRSSFEFNNNFIDNEDFIIHGIKIKPSLSSIIKKGGNHGKIVIEKRINAINKRWTPMTTTSSSQASSIAPPAYVSRRSSLEFNNNFIDDEDLITRDIIMKPSSSIIKKGGNHGNIIIENGINATLTLTPRSFNLKKRINHDVVRAVVFESGG
jgi:hypothetical protein